MPTAQCIQLSLYSVGAIPCGCPMVLTPKDNHKGLPLQKYKSQAFRLFVCTIVDRHVSYGLYH